MVSARARPLDDAVHLPFGFWPVAADRAPGGGDIRGVPVSDNLWTGLFVWLAGAADLYHRRPFGATPTIRRVAHLTPLDGWGQVFVARLTARPRRSCRSRRADLRGKRGRLG